MISIPFAHEKQEVLHSCGPRVCCVGFFPWVLKSLSAYKAGEILYFRILFSSIVLLLIVLAFRNSKLRGDITRFRATPTTEKVKVILLWACRWTTSYNQLAHVHLYRKRGEQYALLRFPT